MSDNETNDVSATPEKATAPSATVPKAKATKAVKPKTAVAAKEGPSHPKYSEMIIEAIKELKLRTGCSRTAILKQMKETHDLGDEKRAATSFKLALKRGVEKGLFKKAKEEGKNSNKYKLGENAEVKPKKKAVKKPAAAGEAKKKKATKPKKAKEAAAVLKKSASTKSKEKASAKRNSIGTPAKVKKAVKKVTAAAAAKTKAAAAKKSDKKPTKAAAAKPAAKKADKKAKAAPAKASAKKPAKK
eukprot:TRINITY_DN7362_c0_g1_i2.p1 TRINITY_DN7362_c0_g1~~TRINITY_DN7362_c0_g1_i2.p1  ORF type:complete len:244 (-),score=99.85 TRINITY_DN7362_c0_g1_i2:70-801(-)